jgi:ATP-dependent DNA ligase
MSGVGQRSLSRAVKSAGSRVREGAPPLPAFIPPQLSQAVEKRPSWRQWLHEIKLDGCRMAARGALNPKLDQLSPWSSCRTRSTPTR